MLRSNARERFEKFVEILFQLHLQFSSSQLGQGERIAVLFDRIADTMLDRGDFGQLERLVCKLRTLSLSDNEVFTANRASIDYILEHWSQESFVSRFAPVLFRYDLYSPLSAYWQIQRIGGSSNLSIWD